MTTTHQITRGFDIPLPGAPEAVLEAAPEPLEVGVDPTEFPGIKPKLLVKEGEQVETGQPLFFDKNDRDLHFVSPATGRVSRIEFGERRTLLRVVISPAPEDVFHAAPAVSVAELAGFDRAELVLRLKRAGLWPMLRQRPVGKLVRSEATPVAIYVNGMDTEPLAADPAFAVRGHGEAFQIGVDLLHRLLDGGKVYLTVREAVVQPKEFLDARRVEMHSFGGPHPAGLVGTHIRKIRPLAAGERVYFLKAPEVVALGEWVRSGRFPTHRVVATAGSRMPAARYFRVRSGAAVMTLTAGKPLGDDTRVVAGTVLGGRAVGGSGFLGYYTYTLTAIPEGSGRRDLFGWMLPGLSKLSASRAVFSWLRPRGTYDADARLHGGRRPIVNIGQWQAMTPLDIHLTYLVRAIQANDLEEALDLGLLEVTEEDVALCTFADPCKIEIGSVIRRGLDVYEAEGGS